MLNLKHLYYFHVFSKQLSTTEAAKLLSISVPALSNQLKELETYLGFQLTKRHNGKVVITEDGKIVAHYAERMFSAYEELKSRVNLKAKPETLLRVGISNNLGVQFAFDLLLLADQERFLNAKQADVYFDSAENLQAGFVNGEYDLVIGAFLFAPNEDSVWTFQKLSFPVRFYVPPDLLKVIKSDVRLADILDHELLINQANELKISLILPERASVLRTETDQFLLNLKVRPERTVECNSSEAILQLLGRGFAMGFFPTPSLVDFISASSLIALGPPAGYWNHEISIVGRKDGGRNVKHISPLADIFFPVGSKK